MVSIEVKMSAVSWTESWESVNNYSHRTKNQNILKLKYTSIKINRVLILNIPSF